MSRTWLLCTIEFEYIVYMCVSSQFYWRSMRKKYERWSRDRTQSIVLFRSFVFLVVSNSKSLFIIAMFESSFVSSQLEYNGNLVYMPLHGNIHRHSMWNIITQSVFWLVHERVDPHETIDEYLHFDCRRFSRSPCVNGSCVCPPQYVGTFCGSSKSSYTLTMLDCLSIIAIQ
jgi:hypothetical protein